MQPEKRLSIKSVTVAGIAAVLLGLAAVILSPAPAGRSCTARTSVIRTVALLGPVSCLGRARWRAQRSGTMPAAI
jgi:hypothetical protein